MKHSKIHLILTVVWVLLLIPTVLWWSESVLWVLIASLYANVVSHLGAYEGAKAAESVEKDSEDGEK